LRRFALFAGAAVLLLAAAIFGFRGTAPERTAEPAVAAAPPPAASLAPVPAAAPQPTKPQPGKLPSFDVVTVTPQGQAVIAGRAAPNDRIRVVDGNRTVGEVTADGNGEWVLVPSAPIPPGDHQIAAEAQAADGSPARRSAGVVALSVQPPASSEPGSLAALVPDDPSKPARLLQPDKPPEAGTLSLDTARYAAADRLALSGRAEPGAQLNVYAGDRLLGTATADSGGKWTLAAPFPPAADGFELRLDQLGSDGKVARRVAAPFQPPPVQLATAQPGNSEPGGAHSDRTYVVRQGNSLWVIARQIYGDGVRYTAIYAANRNQIRDPDMIYPGQQFRLPHS